MKNQIKTFFFLFVFFSSYALWGQNGLFITNSTLSYQELNQEQQTIYNKIDNMVYEQGIEFITIGSMSQSQNNGVINCFIPFDNWGEITFKAKRVRYESETDYVWHGNTVFTDDSICNEGYIAIIVKNGKRHGYLSIANYHYTIYDLGGGVNVMVKKVSPHNMNLVCNTQGLYNTEATNESLTTDFPKYCAAKVLILYNETAINETPDINQLIDDCIDFTEETFFNSGVSPHILLDWVGREQISFSQNFANNPALELVDIRSQTQNLRTQYNADLVVYLTGDDYTDGFDDIAGKALTFDPNNPSNVFDLNPLHSYALVETEHADEERHTFTHELGHLFTAGHENDPRVGIPHGYNFMAKIIIKKAIQFQPRRTMMDRGVPRILHFSNPNSYYDFQTFGGQPMGIPGSSNNALQVYNAGCPVAHYVSGEFEEILTANINGPSTACKDNTVCGITVDVYGPLPPYTFSWSYSYDGINYTNGGAGCVTLPYNVGDKVYVKVVVTHPASGQSVTAWHDITASNTGSNGEGCMLRLGDFSEVSLHSKLYPNPADKIITVEKYSQEGLPLFIEIADVSGKIHVSQSIPTNKGNNKLNISTQNLTSGLYFCKVIHEGYSETHKISIIK